MNVFFRLPYRLVFAIATEDSVLLYDTQHLAPFGYVSGIHYSNLTDISWSSNGQLLSVSSIDGFCTFIMFKENELGEFYVSNVENELPIIESMSQSSSQQAQSSKAPKAENDNKFSEPNRIKSLFANSSKPFKPVINEDEIKIKVVDQKDESVLTTAVNKTKEKRRIKLVAINK
jgi:hypothetical protein